MKNINSENILGVILAGGLSKRFGSDKALQYIGEKTFIEKISDLLKNYFNHVVISSNDLDKYSFLGLPIINDEIENRGPLGGIYSILKKYNQDIFVIACDLPLVDNLLIEEILNSKSKDPIIFATTEDYFQPLCGLYKKEILNNLENYLQNGNNSVMGFVKNIRHTIVANNNIENQLVNINTVLDYELNIK